MKLTPPSHDKNHAATTPRGDSPDHDKARSSRRHPDLVHHFQDSRRQSGQALRDEPEEVRVGLLVCQLQLETILHLVPKARVHGKAKPDPGPKEIGTCSTKPE